MPIDYLALSEQAQVYRAQGDEASARTIADELWRLLAREPDAALELAFDYTRAGQRAEAKKVLEEATGRRRARPGTSREASATEGRDAPGDYPMLNYTLGYLYAEDGEQRRAAELFRQGAAAPPAYVFPHRVEEIAVLETAVATNQRDARAAYYLGNVLAGHGRWSEAIEAWRESARRDEPGNAVAHRNLGLALWQETGNKELAVSEYEQAIKGAPDDYHLYSELDRLLEAMGRTRQRISLLESAPPVVKNHSVVAQALADAYVKVGRFGDGLRVLGQTRFSAGEGEYTVLAIYRRAHLGLAHEHQQAGEHRQAAEEFLKATEYPANLGVGRPAMQSQAREYVAAARELEAAGRKEEAAGWWQKAANDPLNSPTQPEEPWSEHYYYKAVALEHEGRRAEAFELYRRLARLNNEEEMLKAEPSPPEGAIRFELAGAGLKALGKREQARAAFNRALAMDPGNEFARTELSELKN